MDQYPPLPEQRPNLGAVEAAIGGAALTGEVNANDDYFAFLEAQFAAPDAAPAPVDRSPEAIGRRMGALTVAEIDEFVRGLEGDESVITADDLDVIPSAAVFQNEDLAERNQQDQHNMVAAAVAATLFNEMFSGGPRGNVVGLNSARNRRRSRRAGDRSEDNDNELVAA